ncbi:MAG: hypothetical protein ABL998_20205 [Planctomycetota bacterium]
MAYADNELAPAARAEFEQRLAREPALRREVSALRELELLARHAAPKEPADHEWEALAREPVQQAALGLGGGFMVVGGLTLFLYGTYELVRAELAPLLKWPLVALVLGAAFLFGAVLRARLRTLPHDPYRKIQR